MSEVSDVLLCFDGLEEFPDSLERLPEDGEFPVLRYINVWLAERHGPKVQFQPLNTHFGGAKACCHGIAGVSISSFRKEELLGFLAACPWRCPENVQVLIRGDQEEVFTPFTLDAYISGEAVEAERLRARIRGVILNLACADARLAPYEGGVLERMLWRVIGRSKGRLRYTDDTQMNFDILNECRETGELDQDSIARRFASSYHWSRGYGPDAGRILKGIRGGKDWRQLNRKRFSDGSFGNGAAMRAPAIAVVHFQDSQLLTRKVREVSEITHCHPIAIDSALLVAHTVAGVLLGHTVVDSVRNAKDSLETDEFRRLSDGLIGAMEGDSLSTRQIFERFGNSVLATRSVPAALYLAHLHAESGFEVLIDSCRRLGGDADTIGAISGAIWGGVNSADALPWNLLRDVESAGAIEQVAEWAASCARPHIHVM